MNEQIKQFAKQAEKYADENFRGEPTWSEAFESKFAELIIRGCATKANATALDLRIRPELDARKYVGDGILKCFGVEA